MKSAPRVFGPVWSSRLGVSLGVDPLVFKRCSYDCVYCQLGRTRRPSLKRRQHVEPSILLDELRQHLDAIGPRRLDWITVVGAGEPTLQLGLGALLGEMRRLSDAKLAVITNGSLLQHRDVRDELMGADAVLPSLDAGDPDTFRAINRPHGDLDFTQVLEGLAKFRRAFSGKLWVEVMLVAGINDTPEALASLECALERIGADGVHVNVPTRPPAETWVCPPSAGRVAHAVRMLGGSSPVPQPAGPSGHPACFRNSDLRESIMGIVGRHPMTASELAWTLAGPGPERVLTWLQALERDDIVQRVERFDKLFWTTSMARYEGGRARRRVRRGVRAG